MFLFRLALLARKGYNELLVAVTSSAGYPICCFTFRLSLFTVFQLRINWELMEDNDLSQIPTTNVSILLRARYQNFAC